MREFNQIKSELIELAKSKGACKDGIKDAESTTNTTELIGVIKKYISWLINHGVINAEWLDSNFSKEELDKSHLITRGIHDIVLINNEAASIVLIGISSATIETWNSSSVTIKTLGSSSATIETWGSGSVTIETLDNSSATIETFDSSSATIETWNSSSVTIKTWGNSSATIKTFDSSSATYSLGDKEYCNGASIKDLTKGEILVHKNQFKIIEQ